MSGPVRARHSRKGGPPRQWVRPRVLPHRGAQVAEANAWEAPFARLYNAAADAEEQARYAFDVTARLRPARPRPPRTGIASLQELAAERVRPLAHYADAVRDRARQLAEITEHRARTVLPVVDRFVRRDLGATINFPEQGSRGESDVQATRDAVGDWASHRTRGGLLSLGRRPFGHPYRRPTRVATAAPYPDPDAVEQSRRSLMRQVLSTAPFDPPTTVVMPTWLDRAFARRPHLVPGRVDRALASPTIPLVLPSAPMTHHENAERALSAIMEATRTAARKTSAGTLDAWRRATVTSEADTAYEIADRRRQAEVDSSAWVKRYEAETELATLWRQYRTGPFTTPQAMQDLYDRIGAAVTNVRNLGGTAIRTDELLPPAAELTSRRLRLEREVREEEARSPEGPRNSFVGHVAKAMETMDYAPESAWNLLRRVRGEPPVQRPPESAERAAALPLAMAATESINATRRMAGIVSAAAAKTAAAGLEVPAALQRTVERARDAAQGTFGNVQYRPGYARASHFWDTVVRPPIVYLPAEEMSAEEEGAGEALPLTPEQQELLRRRARRRTQRPPPQ